MNLLIRYKAGQTNKNKHKDVAIIHHAVVGKNVAMEESAMSPPSSIEVFYIIVVLPPVVITKLYSFSSVYFHLPS